MSKAIITTINYAGLEFEGLMLPDGTYGVYAIQILKIAQLKTSKNTASRDLKRIAGKDFKTSKTKVEGIKNSVNFVTLNQLTEILMTLAFEGNKFAQNFILASVQEKLERVFDSAFGVIVEEREREARFAARLMTKRTFRPLTDALQEAGFEQGWEFGMYIKDFQTHLGFNSRERDKLNLDTLIWLGNCQSELKCLIKAGYSPWDALELWKEQN